MDATEVKPGEPRPPVVGDGECVRLSCCIPFCGRTFRNDKKGTPWSEGQVVMCGKHWRMAPSDMRARDRQLRRLLRRVERLLPGGKRRRMWTVVARWHDQNWHHARQVITERAAGIA